MSFCNYLSLTKYIHEQKHDMGKVHQSSRLRNGKRYMNGGNPRMLDLSLNHQPRTGEIHLQKAGTRTLLLSARCCKVSQTSIPAPNRNDTTITKELHGSGEKTKKNPKIVHHIPSQSNWVWKLSVTQPTNQPTLKRGIKSDFGPRTDSVSDAKRQQGPARWVFSTTHLKDMLVKFGSVPQVYNRWT